MTPAGDRLHRPRFGRQPGQGLELNQQDDHADARHEPGDDRLGHVADVLARPQQAEGDLNDAAQQDRDEEVLGVRAGGEQAGGHHGHRAGRAADLLDGAAEERGHQPDEDGAVQAGLRPVLQPRGHAEGERQGQGHDADCQAAE
ncbi:hypothetical protein D3C72_1398540 [compost metagenome]